MQDLRRKLGYVAVAFAFWTLVAISFVSLSSATGYGEGNQPPLRRLLLIQFARFYAWGLLAPLIYRLVRRYPIDVRSFSLRNLLIQLCGLAVFCTLHRLLFALASWIFYEPQQSSILDDFSTKFFDGLYLTVIYYLMIVAAIHAFVFYQNYRTEQEQKLRMEAQLAKAELHALKMQIHPHFLFNTLHSISSLVLDDPPKANEMIARLGDFLRLTLEHSEHQFVTLKEELEFARCYLEIEQVRFSDRLHVSFDVDSATLTAEVPHLILQPLVENAIQHSVSPRASGGSIYITARRLSDAIRIEVADGGAGVAALSEISNNGRGVGLSNVRGRLKQIYGADHKFDLIANSTGGRTAVVEIPLVREIEGSPLKAS